MYKLTIRRFVIFWVFISIPYGFTQDKNEQGSPAFHVSNLIQLDPLFTNYVLLVEKKNLKIHIYKNNHGTPERVASFPIATGKVPGDKFIEGDKKTPEGVYQLYRFYNANELIQMYGDYGKIYGIGAFVLNYPNTYDSKLGKTGGGIWLHATDDDSRIEKGLDSRGCVVVTGENLKKISHYINLDLKTPIIVTEDIQYWDDKTFTNYKAELNNFVNNWVKTWQEQDLQGYLSHYSQNLYRPRQGSFQAFSTYKKNVFNNTKDAQIAMHNVSILKHKDYAVIKMKQSYRSNLLDDTGLKTIVVKRNRNYKWEIIEESWSRINKSDSELAFTPSLRYFKE
ncbi:MAG: L,D-transpeptidase family protein [Halobacteriovoraceae bacterium]|nr:L,D-transpeptidase family protein [Halobacteriovoraceae bacterium]MCB9095580.1 L,D-transpeptidase family protein [Halobacteriovoraceae bacterium]